MIRALISGTLHDQPQSRTSQSGNTFALCKVKADDKAGDSVSLSGRAELGTWQDKDGNAHPSLSLVADEVAALRAKPRPREEGRRPPRRSSRPSRQPQPGTTGEFDDLDGWHP